MELQEYIPFLVGAGLFIGAVFSGIFKGRKEQGTSAEAGTKKEVIAGVLQDNYSMIMMSEQLRTNKESVDKLTHAVENNSNELERLREYARDITKILETRIKM